MQKLFKEKWKISVLLERAQQEIVKRASHRSQKTWKTNNFEQKFANLNTFRLGDFQELQQWSVQATQNTKTCCTLRLKWQTDESDHVSDGKVVRAMASWCRSHEFESKPFYSSVPTKQVIYPTRFTWKVNGCQLRAKQAWFRNRDKTSTFNCDMKPRGNGVMDSILACCAGGLIPAIGWSNAPYSERFFPNDIRW